MVQEDDVLPRATEPPFLQHFMRRTTQQTHKTTKLYFSSQVRKQLKLLTGSI